MVEIFIGGITVADRDAERDLLEDAVLNCRSASLNGAGNAANYEGLISSKIIFEKYNDDSIEKAIAEIIYSSYREISEILYDTVPEVDSKAIIDESIEKGSPFNIVTKKYDGNVLTSIDTDICTLNTISKIITIMATANQFILPTLNINKY